MFNQRGRLIIRQLCDKLNVEYFYLTMAKLLLYGEPDYNYGKIFLPEAQ